MTRNLKLLLFPLLLIAFFLIPHKIVYADTWTYNMISHTNTTWTLGHFSPSLSSYFSSNDSPGATFLLVCPSSSSNCFGDGTNVDVASTSIDLANNQMIVSFSSPINYSDYAGYAGYINTPDNNNSWDAVNDPPVGGIPPYISPFDNGAPSDIRPSIASLPNATLGTGGTYTVTGSFTDPDSTSWNATVDYGDGSGTHSLTLNSDKTFSLNHTYIDYNSYTVTVHITDNQGETGSQTATVNVVSSTSTTGSYTYKMLSHTSTSWTLGNFDPLLTSWFVPSDTTGSTSFFVCPQSSTNCFADGTLLTVASSSIDLANNKITVNFTNPINYNNYVGYAGYLNSPNNCCSWDAVNDPPVGGVPPYVTSFDNAVPTPSLVQAINAGGNTSGNFVSDTDFSGGSTYSSAATVGTSDVTNPAPQDVYQSVRFGNFSYTIPNLTPNGTYTIRLHFNELYWGINGSNATGERVFNVSANGTQVLTNYDIFNNALGANKAIVEQVPATADSNGNITLQFTSVTDNAMVSGIEVYNGTLPTPTPPSPITSESINAGGNATGSFIADTDHFGGSAYTTNDSVNTSGATNPAPDAVYQSNRYGSNFTYIIPTGLANTSYHVRLHFDENYWGTSNSGNQGGVGSRVFNVTLDGTQVLNNFDIYQTAGGADKAVERDFNTTTDANGRITINFATVTDNAVVSGIEISKN